MMLCKCSLNNSILTQATCADEDTSRQKNLQIFKLTSGYYSTLNSLKSVCDQLSFQLLCSFGFKVFIDELGSVTHFHELAAHNLSLAGKLIALHDNVSLRVDIFTDLLMIIFEGGTIVRTPPFTPPLVGSPSFCRGCSTSIVKLFRHPSW